MKPVTWDSGIHWDDPNLRWGNPSYLLEPGDLGYVGPKPPRRRRPGQSLFTEPTTPKPATAMSLPYLIIPNSSILRPFRARVKLGPQLPSDDYLDAVAADSGKDRATVEAVTRSLFKIAIGHARGGRPVGNILDLFRTRPTISGSFATNDPSADEIKNGVSFSLSIGPDAQATMTDGLTVEKVGEAGTVAPEVESVVLSPGGQSDKYSTTAAHRISGSAFRGSGENQTWPTVALVDASFASPIALTVFACSQTELLVSPAPGTPTGTKYLKITAGWDNTLVTIYQTPLAHV